ncbi:B3 domain-containing transcription factor VRN1-like [Neltuma alba]|uniref:B3 domain-containing transcription factor VRN1-like n=1 Tax=Neltuma alba TaxID=207710 RepID=UPI0010A2C51B|nr:B3 domain-containing transcription factor VRN1-like [Prosopis alba]
MREGTNRRRWSLPAGKPAHFFKIILPTTILDKRLRVPKTFVNHHGEDFSPVITLRDPNAREWKIGLEKSEEDGDVWFSEGWDKFLEYYSITNEHFLVFRYEGDSRFHVLIFDMSGSEIQYPSQIPSPERNQVASSESSKSNDHDHHWSQNHNDNDNNDNCNGNGGGGGGDYDGGIGHHFTEEYFPDDEDDSTHAYEEHNLYYSTSSSESTSPSPSKSNSPTKRRGFTKFVDQASKRERRKRYSSPSSRSAFQRKRRRRERSASENDEQSDGGSNRRRRRRRSEEGRRRGREKKEDHVERVLKQTVKSKSYKKRHISDRLRAKVLQAADKYRSDFPSFRAVLRPHNLYNSFVYVPARFAVKYLGGGSEKIKLENVKGKQWEARCFNRNGSGNGMNIGEGWAKFKMDNEVKEGDVCVFELIKRKDIVLRVRIFRVRQYADR